MVYQDHIFVIGGDIKAKSNDVWKSADGVTWTEVKANNNAGFTKSDFISSVVHNGEIVIILYALSGGLATVEAWSSSNGKDWKKLYDGKRVRFSQAIKSCIFRRSSLGSWWYR